MTHWARQARNKAMGDKRKAEKQGSALVDFMRSQNGTNGKRENQISPDNSLETPSDGDDQGSGEPLPALRDKEDADGT